MFCVYVPINSHDVVHTAVLACVLPGDRDPEKVTKAYTEDCIWRNRLAVINVLLCRL